MGGSCSSKKVTIESDEVAKIVTDTNEFIKEKGEHASLRIFSLRIFSLRIFSLRIFSLRILFSFVLACLCWCVRSSSRNIPPPTQLLVSSSSLFLSFFLSFSLTHQLLHDTTVASSFMMYRRVDSSFHKTAGHPPGGKI